MTRPTFDWAESPGSRLREVPKVRMTQFGDGYSQRQADGINSILQDWVLLFRSVSREAGDEIIAFLRQQNGVTAFNWAPVWATSSIVVLCPEWSRTALDDFGFSDITARFQQTYEP
jgi:phage-related protein